MEKVKYLLLCVVVIIYVFNECHVHGAKSKYVTMNLDTKWAYTPLMLEASEFLAEEGNEKFWSFVNKVGEQNPESYINDHEEAHYQMTLKFAKDVLSSFQLNLLKFALSMRAHSPRVEMFNQIGWNKISPKSCDAFVDVNNMITCDKESLKSFIGDAQGQPKPLTVKSDHHYPGTEFVNTTVILYCELGTQAFHDWHQVLREMADRREINYILRHYIKTPSDRRVRLSGYGVELAIKSQEYKAKDDTKVEGDDNSQADDTEEDVELGGFDFAQLKKIYPDLKEDLDKFKQHLLYSNNELAELKVWQFQDLSFQAAQMLMSAKVENRLSLLGDLSFQAAQTVMSAKVEDRLRVLRDVSQNFPVQTRFLSKTAVNDDLRKEIKKNQDVWQGKLGLQAGDSAMFINGMQADLDTYDVFTLLDTLKSEAKMMEGMHSLGVKGEDLSAMLKIDLSETETNYAVDYRDPSVVYINNLEKDRRYQGWPSSVTELLRPTFPGMLRHIRKNLFTGVFIVDPSNLKHRDLLKMAEAFYVHTAPVRMGLLFVVNGDPEVDGMEDAGVALYRAFNYLSKEERPMKALEFITEIYDKIAQDGTIQLTGELVIEELKSSYSSYINTDKIFGVDSLYDENRRIFGKAENSEVTASLVHEQLAERRPHVTKEEIFGEGGKQYDKNRQEAVEFFEKTGLGELPQVLINGVPMKKTEMEADNFEESLVSSMLALTPELQKSVYNGFLYDGQDIEQYIMTRSNVMPRLNFKVLTPGTKYLDLTQTQSGSLVGEPEKFAKLSNADKIGAMMASLKYLTKKEESSIHAVSNWVIGDLDTPEGRGLVYEAIKQLKSSSTTRLGIVHNPSSISKKDNSISKAIQVAVETLPAGMAKSFVTKLVKEENVLALQKGEKTFEDLSVHNMDMASFNKALETKNIAPLLESHKYFCQYVLGFQAGQRGIITNGKIIGPLNEGEKFIQEDFVLLEKFLSKSSAGKIERAVKKMNWEHEKSSDLIMKVASLLLSTPQSDSSRTDTPYYSQKNSVINIAPNDPDSPAYDVVAVLDPSTRAAQKYTPLIMALGQVANANIKVFFNCREKLSDLPLKSFYRYVLEPEVRFNAESKLSIGPSVSFKDLPQKPILTLGVDSPESWLVEAVRALHDLDNIHLQDMESSVHADFELEYLLLEGHCFDAMSGQPPRGLQFVLGTDKKPAIVDTIVMANLGYFQLKAAPGLWNLELRSGKSREIYDIASHEFTDSPADSKDILVVIDTLKSKIVKVRVAKKPGKEKDNLLSDTKEEEPQGFWDSLSSQFVGGSGKGTGTGEDKDDTINIFSLASGHLYERFMRIMILSVLKTTKSNVKFWFLKNYLSPSFIDFIPHMAAEYNFEYEMVQYKWPRWLHQQTEKQRVMWGYKILFLDVLFPLNINKIIFVDADQIVRTDLKELVDLDLEGAPYGYTPFCDSRTEMDGFRFWKSGYWNSHLAGRRYHISALYVVDLKKFRKIAAGDRLRGQYQGLSQDPNSLSNLDQDLPNNMIHQVPIKSLPQEWLWCETWCSDAEKSKAKTIDLCNNPRTKEPKLSAAVRIVPEWTDYDNEAKALWDKVYKSKTSKIDNKETKTDKKDSHTEL